MGFPGSSDGKEFACNVGNPSSIPGSGISPREGNENPLQDCCLKDPTDRGATNMSAVTAARRALFQTQGNELREKTDQSQPP